ncbi:MAG: hypothetical protein NXI30_04675 [bacterium]|nr:hypothetical protein [bacterium]
MSTTDRMASYRGGLEFLRRQRAADVAAALKDQAADWDEAMEKLPDAAKRRREALEVIEKFGTPELRAWLDDTSVGRHPELINLLSRIKRETRSKGRGK